MSASPVLPCYNVKDFGATGGGVTLDTMAINHTIIACHRSGGGTVFVPAGAYLIGTVELLDNITLHLDAGAVLKGSPNMADYRVLPRRSEMRDTALVIALNARNIAITGRGVIDGNGEAFAEPGRPDLSRDFHARHTRQGEAYFSINDQAEDGPIVHKVRPGILVLFINCRDILVSDIKIVDAPNWCLHLACCEDALLTGLELQSSLLLPNSDGIDVSLCRNVRISDCNIEAGDDGIALSPCADGFGSGSEENITVENCIISSRSAGIRIGWGEHPFKNLFFNNIIIRNSNRGIGLFVRGKETIENVVFSNIFIETRFYKGKWWGKAEPIHISAVHELTPEVRLGVIRNITFSHVIIEAEHGIVLWTAEPGRPAAGFVWWQLRPAARRERTGEGVLPRYSRTVRPWREGTGAASSRC
jgi:polygalacturonase